MSKMPEQSYWKNNGRHEEASNNLQALVPAQGEAKKGSPLELFRVAGNAYYDLWNNGMGNAPQRLAPLLETLKAYRSKGILATEDAAETALWKDVAALERFYEEFLEAEAFDPLDLEEDDVYDNPGYPNHERLYFPMERLMDAVIRYASSTQNPETPDSRLHPTV